MTDGDRKADSKADSPGGASPTLTPISTVAIVGVGLIGASFGLAMRKAGFGGRLLGVSSEKALAAGIQFGAIDSGASLEEAVSSADLIYLAQPIGRILDRLRMIDAHVRSDALVTDAGSTKQAILTQARAHLKRCRFLGGHPLAGKESSGAANADADLFQGRAYVLCPASPDELLMPRAAEFVGWIQKIGAKALILGAAEHDRVLAFTSHLPQLASTALAATLSEQTPEAARVSGPGLLDSTRLALSSYEIWRDILSTNDAEIIPALDAYIGKLEHLRDNLRTREIQKEFAAAAQFAQTIRGS